MSHCPEIKPAVGPTLRDPVSHLRFDLLNWVFFLIATICYLWVGLHWLDPAMLIAWIGFSLICALPGWGIGIWWGGRRWLTRVEFWVGGVIVGWGINSYLLLVVGYLLGRVQLWPIWLCAGAGLIALALFYYAKPTDKMAIVRPWDRGAWRILLFTLAVVMVFVARPLLQVGSLTPDGYAFPWLFGFDFTNRVSIAANAAVCLPPEYFHIYGETFHYYLLTYMMPVAFRQLVGTSAEMFSSLLLWGLNLTVVFTVLLVACLRMLVSRTRALWLTVLTGFVSYSFYWTYVAVKAYALNHPGSFPATVGDGNWLAFSNVSHLVYRYFLVEPQTIFSLALLLVTLGYLLRQGGHLDSRLAGLGLGFTLGLVFGADALLTVWAALALVVVALFDLYQSRRRLGPPLLSWMIAALTAMVMAYGYYDLGMYAQTSSRSLIVGFHQTIGKIFPAFMLVEFGPLLILGLVGGVLLFLRNRAAGVTWWVLCITGVFTIVFVQSQYDDQLGLLKGTRLLYLLFLLATAGFWQWYTSQPRSKTANIICAVLLVLALPTWATDWLKTSDVSDKRETVYVYPADYQACRWIKANLPPTARVQSSPGYTNYRQEDGKSSPYLYPLIANFAERPMAVGSWGMPQMIPDIQDKFIRTVVDIKAMFSAREQDSVMLRVDRYGIDYLYYGPYERQRWPSFAALLASGPERLTQVYDQDGVEIYRVAH